MRYPHRKGVFKDYVSIGNVIVYAFRLLFGQKIKQDNEKKVVMNRSTN